MIIIRLPRKLSIFVILICLLAAFALKLSSAGTSPQMMAARGTWAESRASQLVFFAVLEGLYRDGVSNEDVDLIIPKDKFGKRTFDREYFVYACPLCHPAYEALKLYRSREEFYGFKGYVDTLGPGLDGPVAERLRSANPAERRGALEELINRWVAQRLEMMRLSPAERDAITKEIEQGRKKGMNELRLASRASSQARTNCPICDGSFGACKVR